MKFASSVVTESPVQRAGSSRSAGKCPEMCQAGPRCLGTGTCQQRHPGRSSHTEELAWCAVKVPLGLWSGLPACGGTAPSLPAGAWLLPLSRQGRSPTGMLPGGTIPFREVLSSPRDEGKPQHCAG